MVYPCPPPQAQTSPLDLMREPPVAELLCRPGEADVPHFTSADTIPTKGREKKSNYHVDPQLSQRGGLNMSHNSVGGSVDGGVTLGGNNKGF